MLFSGVDERVAEVRERIAAAVERGGHGQSVRLVAVTKTHGPEAVDAVAAAGVMDVGENKVQEALAKQDAVTAPVRWHLIGHLQRNKAKHAGRFALIHSMDSLRLAEALDRVGTDRGEPLAVLMQVNVAGEETKGGLAPDEWEEAAGRLHAMPGLRVQGVMTMAPFDAADGTLRRVFAGARSARAVLVSAGLPATELSMGMSGDYEVAVEEGATLVRLGTVLFGARAT